MAPKFTEETIGTVEKKDDERIVIGFREFKGHQYVDIRTEFRDKEGKWLPTKKGVTVGFETFEDLATLIQKAVAKAKELELL